MFQSFLQAGFECSTHKRRNGLRLDLVKSTGHDRLAVYDFRLLGEFGIKTVREGARWHLIEQAVGSYNFDSLKVILDAADKTGTEVILDLFHFGWPDHVDVFSLNFASVFERYVSAVAHYLKSRVVLVRFITPVNEISFLSWGGGCKGCINPYETQRAGELKANLVRAATRACEVLLNELPGVRLVSTEPVINIVGNVSIPGDEREAEMYRLAQFEAWDMLCGRLHPELGGRPEYLDILGVNFYDRNQWVHNSECLTRGDPRYRPFRDMLHETAARYGRPLFVAETGAEDGVRAEWFNYVCDEVRAALDMSLPVHGICLYPILNHPGWDDDRHCQNGLLDMPDETDRRNIHWPLAHALRQQQQRFTLSKTLASHERNHYRPHLSFTSSMELRLPTSSALDESLREDPASLLL